MGRLALPGYISGLLVRETLSHPEGSLYLNESKQGNMRSKERSRVLGEVFTRPSEVSAVLDLFTEVNYLSRFLEPGCGSGNFLVQIVDRKLASVLDLPEVQQGRKLGNFDEIEVKGLLAVASIYGVDIDEQNVLESRSRMMSHFTKWWHAQVPTDKRKNGFEEALHYVLNKNVILGDLLSDVKTLKVSEFTEIPGKRVKERIYSFGDLIFPDAEVFDEGNILFGHVPIALFELDAKNYWELGA
jgi:hypothetical protein